MQRKGVIAQLASSKKAEMAIGTLVIFIAMIVVAAVVAGTLVSTTGSLQNKALETGKATRQQISTQISVIDVTAENGNDSTIEEFEMTIKTASGSDPIKFEDLLLSMRLSNTSADFTYNSSIDCSNDAETIAGDKFGIDYALEGSQHRADYLTRGDVVKVCFEAPRSVAEYEEIHLRLTPQFGLPVTISTNSPDLIYQTKVAIYP